MKNLIPYNLFEMAKYSEEDIDNKFVEFKSYLSNFDYNYFYDECFDKFDDLIGEKYLRDSFFGFVLNGFKNFNTKGPSVEYRLFSSAFPYLNWTGYRTMNLKIVFKKMDTMVYCVFSNFLPSNDTKSNNTYHIEFSLFLTNFDKIMKIVKDKLIEFILNIDYENLKKWKNNVNLIFDEMEKEYLRNREMYFPKISIKRKEEYVLSLYSSNVCNLEIHTMTKHNNYDLDIYIFGIYQTGSSIFLTSSKDNTATDYTFLVKGKYFLDFNEHEVKEIAINKVKQLYSL
jgi:hypothetical protein